MGFSKGASIPFGRDRGQYPGREVDSFNRSLAVLVGRIARHCQSILALRDQTKRHGGAKVGKDFRQFFLTEMPRDNFAAHRAKIGGEIEVAAFI